MPDGPRPLNEVLAEMRKRNEREGREQINRYNRYATKLVRAQQVKRVEGWGYRLMIFGLAPLYVLLEFVRLSSDPVVWVWAGVSFLMLALAFVDHHPRVE